jgi:hypothetical protein
MMPIMTIRFCLLGKRFNILSPSKLEFGGLWDPAFVAMIYVMGCFLSSFISFSIFLKRAIEEQSLIFYANNGYTSHLLDSNFLSSNILGIWEILCSEKSCFFYVMCDKCMEMRYRWDVRIWILTIDNFWYKWGWDVEIK